jgi:hypothetical protein
VRIYNSNPAFGDCGPFEIDAPTFDAGCAKLADAQLPLFVLWAQVLAGRREVSNPELPESPPREAWIAAMRREFIRGLVELDRAGVEQQEECCDVCGHSPAMGNVVYESSGHRPLCPRCNAEKSKNSDVLIDLVCGFVEKSGGIRKVNEMGDALRAMAESGDVRIQQFLRGVAANPAGAKEILAAALLGFRMAGFVYERRQRTVCCEHAMRAGEDL